MPQMRRSPPHGSRPPSPPRRRRRRRVDGLLRDGTPANVRFRTRATQRFVFSPGHGRPPRHHARRAGSAFRGAARDVPWRAEGNLLRRGSVPDPDESRRRESGGDDGRDERRRRGTFERVRNRDGANEDAAVRRVRAAASGWDGVRERARGEQVRARGRGGVRRRGARPRMDSTRKTSRDAPEHDVRHAGNDTYGSARETSRARQASERAYDGGRGARRELYDASDETGRTTSARASRHFFPRLPFLPFLPLAGF